MASRSFVTHSATAPPSAEPKVNSTPLLSTRVNVTLSPTADCDNTAPASDAIPIIRFPGF